MIGEHKRLMLAQDTHLMTLRSSVDTV